MSQSNSNFFCASISPHCTDFKSSHHHHRHQHGLDHPWWGHGRRHIQWWHCHIFLTPQTPLVLSAILYTQQHQSIHIPYRPSKACSTISCISVKHSHWGFHVGSAARPSILAAERKYLSKALNLSWSRGGSLKNSSLNVPYVLRIWMTRLHSSKSSKHMLLVRDSNICIGQIPREGSRIHTEKKIFICPYPITKKKPVFFNANTVGTGILYLDHSSIVVLVYAALSMVFIKPAPDILSCSLARFEACVVTRECR